MGKGGRVGIPLVLPWEGYCFFRVVVDFEEEPRFDLTAGVLALGGDELREGGAAVVPFEELRAGAVRVGVLLGTLLG